MKPVYANLTEYADIYKCPKCKLLWGPNLSIDKNFQSELDEGNRKTALEKTRVDEFNVVLELMKTKICQGARGLDVGCSYGWFIKACQKDFKCEGIEAEDSVARQARKILGGGYEVYSGFFPDDMPKDCEKYDFIIFNNAWEHINQTGKLLEGCAEYLKPDGYLIVTVPLSSGILYKISELFCRLGRKKELIRLWQLKFHSPHIYYFNKKNLTLLMKKYGFEAVQYKKLQSIDTSKMKERFEMDKTETNAALKAFVFKICYPIIRLLPEDKGVFIYRKK